jgi:hypothetical protein
MRISKHQKIINQLSLFRDAHPQIKEIFLNGSCINLFMILKSFYPEAVPYYNIDHIITRIGASYYDITGRVNPKGYSPFTNFYNKKGTSRAFAEMYNGK